MDKKERAENSLEETLSELNKKLEELKGRTEESVRLKGDIKTLETQKAFLKKEIETLTNTEGILKYQVQELKQQKDSHENLCEEVNTLQTSVYSLQEEKKTLTEEVAVVKGDLDLIKAERSLADHHLYEVKETTRDMQEAVNNFKEKERIVDEKHADALRIFAVIDERKRETEALKEEFIVEPLSIGHYISGLQMVLKNKGVDIDLMKEIQQL